MCTVKLFLEKFCKSSSGQNGFSPQKEWSVGRGKIVCPNSIFAVCSFVYTTHLKRFYSIYAFYGFSSRVYRKERNSRGHAVVTQYLYEKFKSGLVSFGPRSNITSLNVSQLALVILKDKLTAEDIVFKNG